MRLVHWKNGLIVRKTSPIQKFYGEDLKFMHQYEGVEIRMFRIKFPSGKCSPSYQMYIKRFEGDTEVEIEIVPPSTSWERDKMSVFSIGMDEKEAIALATKSVRSKYAIALSCDSIVFNKPPKEKI